MNIVAPITLHIEYPLLEKQDEIKRLRINTYFILCIKSRYKLCIVLRLIKVSSFSYYDIYFTGYCVKDKV